MTFNKLYQIIAENNIPHDVILMSDSGWECDETHMNGVYYSSKLNTIIFTQKSEDFDKYFNDISWQNLI